MQKKTIILPDNKTTGLFSCGSTGNIATSPVTVHQILWA
jgi:hypothetical protein